MTSPATRVRDIGIIKFFFVSGLVASSQVAFSLVHPLLYALSALSPVREGETNDRGVPYHAESTLSSAQVLKDVPWCC